jgi:hypothetical protein
MVSLILWAGPFGVQKADAAQITSRSLKLSDARGGNHNTTYSITFTPGTTGLVGSMEFQFCSNSALIEDSCTAPYGLDLLNANVISQSGTAGFMKSNASSVNDFIVNQNVPITVSSTPINFTLDAITNPTFEGSYYLKVFTYSNTTASGVPIDFGAMAFPINPGFSVSSEVPPYLTFCGSVSITNFDCSTANDSVIDFGQFSSAVASAGQSQLVAATNAGSGYSIYVNGTTMTSGNNILAAMQNDTSKVGTSQFGINLRNNTSPNIGEDITGPGTGTVTTNYNQVNRYRFTAGENIATATQAQDFRKYTISYVVNVDKNQAPGVYSTTLTYVCLANF